MWRKILFLPHAVHASALVAASLRLLSTLEKNVNAAKPHGTK
jgi:hypothetical protein